MKPIRLIFDGETFSGRKGIRIGECIYCDTPLEAIKKYCSDEIHCADINDYEWVYDNGEKEETIYKGE